MPPGAPSRHSEREKRVKSLLSFAAELQHQIASLKVETASRRTLQDLEKQVAIFPSNIGSLSVTKCAEIDAVATGLWNLCTRVRRDQNHDESCNDAYIIFAETILLAKAFSFLLLDCTRYYDQCTLFDVARLMKIALRTAKTSMNHERYDVTVRIMERASGYEQMLKKPEKPPSSEDEEIYAQMISEYFILRTALAWRQDKFDIAEHMFTKVETLDPMTTENLADTIFEMGKDLLKKKQYEMAVKWLDRASEMLATQELDKLSMEASELRISILQCTVDALIKLQDKENLDKARNIVSLLSSEVGDKLLVLLLKLEILSSSINEEFDNDAYYDILRRIMRSVTLSKENFKLVMNHIRKLHDKSPTLACSAIDEFLSDRILEENNLNWTERAVVSRILMITSQPQDRPDMIHKLHHMFEQVAVRSRVSFSVNVTHAAHMLLWKRIETSMIQNQYETAQLWCQLALHRIFEGAGEMNIAKITRKLLMCVIAQKDNAFANEIFSKMPKESQDAPLTRFLMFKIAIRERRTELASECLGKLYDNMDSDSSMFLACVMHAQQAGDALQAAAALQLVLQKTELHPHNEIHVPALLRCTLRLYVLKLAEQESNGSTTVDEICALFESAVSQAQTSLSSSSLPKQFTVEELTFFAKNTYGLAMKHSSDWAPYHVLRMVKFCKTFIMMIPQDINESTGVDLDVRLMSCDFLASLLLVAMARSEDNIEIQLDKYLDLQHHVRSFDEKLEQRLLKLEDVVKQDLLDKLGILLAWEFEAAIQLKQWENLKEIMMRAEICKKVRPYEIMADCILCSEASNMVKIATLKSIVNEVWGIDTLDTAKLSRYLRVLFQLSTSENDPVAEELLDQVAGLAHEAGEGIQVYPADELEWMATMAFNRAVDFYVIEDDQTCKRWAEKALNIAACCMDNGNLQNTLQERFMGLKFETS